QFELLVMAREIGAVAVVAAAAEEEHLDAGVPAGLVRGDHVGLVEAGDVDRLVRLDVGERAGAVAEARRRLGPEGLALRLHLPRQPLLHLTAASRQELARLADQRLVVRGADAADAGAGAALDLILQAGSRAAGIDAVGAGAQ